MKKDGRARLQLVVSEGMRTDKSGDGTPTFHGQDCKGELPSAQGLDLPGATFGDLTVPHTHGFSGDPKSISERLMSATEVVEDFLERDTRRSHGASVSMLPRPVKRLTRDERVQPRKLVYMGRRQPKDQWAIERGAAMKAARLALGKSQAEIAELAGVKDRETISQYESGIIADIDPAVIPKLAMALGLPAQRLSRTPWSARDEAADLKISNVARQIAYSFDQYPLAIQNQIRETIAKYESMVRLHGKNAVDTILGSTAPALHVVPEKAEPKPPKRQRTA